MSNSKLLFDINGDLYRATAFEKLNEEDLNRELSEAQAEVSSVQEAIDFSNKLQSNDSTTFPEPTTPPAVEEPVTPEAPAPETPAVEAPAQPVVPSYPTETIGVPTPPEAPANDSPTAPTPIVLS